MKYYLEDIQPVTEFGKELKHMVENGEHCDGNIYWLIEQAEKVEQLQYYKNYFEKETERHLNTLAVVRDELLNFVDTNNPCGDMLACTVSNPDCMSCLAKNIKEKIKRYERALKTIESESIDLLAKGVVKRALENS